MSGRGTFSMRRLRSLVMVTLGFSRSEARAFIILLPLVFVIVFIQPVYQTLFPSGKPDLFADAKQLDSLLATFTWPTDDSVQSKGYHVFHFDPNKISITEMDSLGIPNRIGQRVEKYRLKGGKF